MNFWAKLSQDNKVQILLVFIAALLSSLGYLLKDKFSTAPASTPQAQAAAGLAGGVENNAGIALGSLNMGDGNSVEIGSDHSVRTDNSTHYNGATRIQTTTNNHSGNRYREENHTNIKTVSDKGVNIEGSNNTVNNGDNNYYNSSTIVNNVPTEAQKAAEQKRKQKLAHSIRKRSVYQAVSSNFHDSTVFTLDQDSLFASLEYYAQSKAVLSDIEINFSRETQQQAQAFFDNARDTIACAWGERNQPQSCHNQNRNHPEQKYKRLFAELKFKMAGELEQP